VRTAVNDAIAAITAAILRESPFGDVAVAVVNVQEGTGPHDRPYLHFVVSASDPDPQRGTWSREGVFALRSRVNELAAQVPTELPQIVVDVYPESADDEEGSAAEQESSLAQDLDDPGQ
jgi:hypothetical protein